MGVELAAPRGKDLSFSSSFVVARGFFFSSIEKVLSQLANFLSLINLKLSAFLSFSLNLQLLRFFSSSSGKKQNTKPSTYPGRLPPLPAALLLQRRHQHRGKARRRVRRVWQGLRRWRGRGGILQIPRLRRRAPGPGGDLRARRRQREEPGRPRQVDHGGVVHRERLRCLPGGPRPRRVREARRGVRQAAREAVQRPRARRVLPVPRDAF